MEALARLGSWISDNESLLSGLAALIVLLGVIASPTGIARRRILRRRAGDGTASRRDESTGRDPAPSPSIANLEKTPPPEPTRLTLKALTAPSPHPVRFAQSDGARIAFSERGEGPISLLIAPGIISHLNVWENLPVIRGTLDAFAA